MIDEKPWFQSKTIWGALVAVGSALAGSIGIAIDAENQLAISNAMLQLTSACGALVAIYGRLSATDMIEQK